MELCKVYTNILQLVDQAVYPASHMNYTRVPCPTRVEDMQEEILQAQPPQALSSPRVIWLEHFCLYRYSVEYIYIYSLYIYKYIISIYINIFSLYIYSISIYIYSISLSIYIFSLYIYINILYIYI